MPNQPKKGPLAGAILELIDHSTNGEYFTAIAIRPTAADIKNIKEVRGTYSNIQKGDYYADNMGTYTVYVRSSDSNETGHVYELYTL
jgi:hypothetical protein